MSQPAIFWVMDGRQALLPSMIADGFVGSLSQPQISPSVNISSGQFDFRVRYRDPYHDFAIIQLVADTQVIDDLTDIELKPEDAVVGCDIFVVSNDSDLDGSLAQGVIIQTDCDVLDESIDVNTPYMLANMAHQGGSSGAIAVNSKGQGVGLHCGGTDNLSFFLPLSGPKEALDSLRQGIPYNRGDVLIRWAYLEFHTAQTRGVPESWMNAFREAGVTKVIFAKSIVPRGPAYGLIDVGDILLKIDHLDAFSLDKVTQYMDRHVNQMVTFKVWKGFGDGEIINCTMKIADLHQLTPHRIIRRCGTIFHLVPPFVGLVYNIPLEGVMVPVLIHTPFKPYRLIEAIDGKSISSLDDVTAALSSADRGTFITVRHRPVEFHGSGMSENAYLSWASSQTSGDFDMESQPLNGGEWTVTRLSPPRSIPSPFSGASAEGTSQQVDGLDQAPIPASSDSTLTPDVLAKAVFSGMVSFQAYRNPIVDIVVKRSSEGHGFYAGSSGNIGYVLVLRADHAMFDEVVLTFSKTFDVQGRVSFLHPTVNVAVVVFELDQVPTTLPSAHPLAPKKKEWLQPGEEVIFAPFYETNRILIRTKILSLDEGHMLDDSETRQTMNSGFVPLWFARCLFDKPLVEETGLLLNASGQIAGLITGTDECIPSTMLHDVIEAIQKPGQVEKLWFADFMLEQKPIINAFRNGLNLQKWHEPLTANDNSMALFVRRVPRECRDPIDKQFIDHPLRLGDVVLQVLDSHGVGRLVTRFQQVGFQWTEPSVRLRIFRSLEDGKGGELTVQVPLLSIKEANTYEVFQLCGAWMQRPNVQLRMAGGVMHSEIFCSAFAYGTPAQQYNLQGPLFVVAINGKKVDSMTDLQEAVEKIPFHEYFHITTMRNDNLVIVTIIKDALGPTGRWGRPVCVTDGSIKRSLLDKDMWLASLPSGVICETP